MLILLEWWRPLTAAVLLCGLIIVIGPSDSTDRRISDRLLVSQAKPVDGSFVLIEVTGEDIRKYGQPLLSRQNLAALLDVVADQKPLRLMVDIYLGEQKEARSDAAIEAALARLGPTRVALTSAQSPDNLPYEGFAQYATILDGRLTSDADGWHRRLGSNQRAFGYNPANWLAKGESISGEVQIDLRKAHWEYPRYSVEDVFDGQVSLSGKIVILSPSPDIAPTRAFLPLANSASRSAVIAVAAESVTDNYSAVAYQGKQANIVLQLIAVALGFVTAFTAKSGKWMVVRSAVIAFVLIILSFAIATNFGAPIAPTKVLACFLVMINVTLIQRFNIVPMVSSFIKGDISPEEAWSWRSLEGSNNPALLFSAQGTIKRSNAAAQDLVRLHGSELVHLCLPAINQRSVKATMPEGDGRYFDIEWPYGDVPIAVLRDQTEVELLNQDLRVQLHTDSLTGILNRRGFDTELANIAKANRPYTLMFLDLNGFKQVNDTLGHDAGDEVLAGCASRLEELMRDGDTLARLGGDEFAIILAGTDDDRFIKSHRHRITESLSKPFKLVSVEKLTTVGAAIGIASPHFDGERPAEILRRADQDMYRNKVRLKRPKYAA